VQYQPPTPARPPIQIGPGSIVHGLPVELWLVIGLFAAAGAVLTIQALRAVPATFDLMDIFFRFGLALLLLLVAIGALGVGLLAIAWLLYRADLAGRGLAYVATGMVVAAVVFGEDPGTSDVVALALSLGAAAVLALSQGVRAHFTGPNARDSAEPTSIVVARVCVLLLSGCLTLVSLAFLLLGSEEGRYIAVAIGLIGVAAGGFVYSTRLRTADRQARLVVSVGSAAAAVLLLFGLHDGGSVMLLGLTVAIPAARWLPPDARAFFGDAPLELASR
jgi:hypothetical protein